VNSNAIIVVAAGDGVVRNGLIDRMAKRYLGTSLCFGPQVCSVGLYDMSEAATSLSVVELRGLKDERAGAIAPALDRDLIR
jgi:hypothetical protein